MHVAKNLRDCYVVAICKLYGEEVGQIVQLYPQQCVCLE